MTPELSAIEDIATTDPRGSEAPLIAPSTGTAAPGGAIRPGSPTPSAPVDVAINAVIVSAAQSPWDAIRKDSRVRNVIVTGGIVALGKTPIARRDPGRRPAACLAQSNPRSQTAGWLGHPTCGSQRD